MDQILNFVVNIGIIVLIISILVLIHELGHFLAAKLFNVRVDEFSLGFGPKLLSKKRGETEYMIKAFPLGGYVKILGEGDEFPDEEGIEAERKLREKLEKDPRSLKNKPKFAQFIVMVAGVTMNVILAVILFYIVLAKVNYTVMLTPDFVDYRPIAGTYSVEKSGDFIYAALVDGSGAKTAGMPETGLIKSVDGNGYELSLDFVKYVKAKKGETVSMNVCDVKGLECKDYQVKVSDQGSVGISYAANFYVQIKYEGVQQVFAGFIHAANQVTIIGYYIPRLFQQAAETGNYEKLAVNGVSSPIALYFVVDAFRSEGIYAFLDITASLSFSLAIVNILPIPALDGGRILLILIEWIRRKPLKPKTEALIIGISFYLLMGFMLVIVLKDVLFIGVFRDLFAR